MPEYRLTESEYITHLENSGDPFPETTLHNVRNANGRYVVDGAHGSASYDTYDYGWVWVKTDNLRVDL
jgi:hypothetical protein